jgi:hypothetical protein
MKISLKSETLDLDIDGIKKLDDVLDFIEKFKKLELAAELSKVKLAVENAEEAQKKNKPASKRTVSA